MVRREADRLGFEPDVVIVNETRYFHQLGAWPAASLNVFDMVDDYATFTDDPDLRARIRRWEAEAIDRANLVTATHPRILEKAVKRGADAVLVPNGTNVDHFAKPRQAPDELKGLPRPIAGYVGGTESHRLDYNLVVEMAHLLPEASFVFIGPAGPELRRAVVSLPNVHVLGFRDYRDLPGYVQAFDVGLLPFKTNVHMAHVDPLKLYEYWAAGIGAVATPFGALGPRLGTLAVAATPEEFARAITEMAGMKEAGREARLLLARRGDWTVRVDAWEEAVMTRLRACEG
jgi:hypothetical protein